MQARDGPATQRTASREAKLEETRAHHETTDARGPSAGVVVVSLLSGGGEGPLPSPISPSGSFLTQNGVDSVDEAVPFAPAPTDGSAAVGVEDAADDVDDGGEEDDDSCCWLIAKACW